MKNLKIMLAVALATACGAALAEWIEPLPNGAMVYNPASGQYESGCGAAQFHSYSPYAYTAIPALLNGTSTTVYFAGGSAYIWCSGGTIYASGNSYDGELLN